MKKYQDIKIEEDFWDDFIVEAFEHIEDIENNAMSLEQNPEDMEIIHTMFRSFHTIKGLSGFVEHTAIQEVAHKTETMMDCCRKGELKVNTKIIDSILKSSDYIKRLCDDVNAFKDDTLVQQIEDLIVVLEELANGESMTTEENGESEVTSEIESPINQELEMTQNNVVETEIQQAEVVQELNNLNEEEEPFSPEKGLEAFANEILEFESDVEVDKDEQVVETVETKLNSEDSLESSQNSITEELENGESFVICTSSEAKAKPNPQTQSPIQIPNKSKPIKPATKVTSVSEDYMKVANYKIDNLVEIMGELIINQSLMEQYVSGVYGEDRQLITNMSGFSRITRELQYLSMSLRMVSLKSTFQKLTRISRDTIHELNKNVEFVTSGENTEIDRVVADKLLDPLVHMIKNAISHGIEKDAEARKIANKSPKARVELNAYSKRGKIFIEVKDDGRGINTEVVYKKAVEKGLVDPNKAYTDVEIKEFIMLPGFSTAEVVDNISGRGVGMDVVKTQILKSGGKVDIQSTLHEGSTFTLEVPINNSIMNGTIIEINKQHFVVPTTNVKEFLQPKENQWIFTKQERTMIRVRDNIIPIVPPTAFFKDVEAQEHVPLVMLLESGQELRAVPITNVINRQEVVVKPVSEEFSHLDYISGMSILGTGKVSLILDVEYLFRKEIKE